MEALWLSSKEAHDAAGRVTPTAEWVEVLEELGEGRVRVRRKSGEVLSARWGVDLFEDAEAFPGNVPLVLEEDCAAGYPALVAAIHGGGVSVWEAFKDGHPADAEQVLALHYACPEESVLDPVELEFLWGVALEEGWEPRHLLRCRDLGDGRTICRLTGHREEDGRLTAFLYEPGEGWKHRPVAAPERENTLPLEREKRERLLELLEGWLEPMELEGLKRWLERRIEEETEWCAEAGGRRICAGDAWTAAEELARAEGLEVVEVHEGDVEAEVTLYHPGDDEMQTHRTLHRVMR